VVPGEHHNGVSVSLHHKGNMTLKSYGLIFRRVSLEC
jgi:hypothetical protein